MATSSPLRFPKLPASNLSAIKRRAKGLGLSPEDYFLQLIEDDLAISQRARNTSLEELAAPYTRALKGLSEDQLDQLVNEARRTPPAPRRSRR